MKKIYYLCFLFLCLFLTINVKATISVDSSLKIYDYGELLTEEEEISLKEEIDTFVNQYDLDMVVVIFMIIMILVSVRPMMVFYSF